MVRQATHTSGDSFPPLRLRSASLHGAQTILLLFLSHLSTPKVVRPAGAKNWVGSLSVFFLPTLCGGGQGLLESSSVCAIEQ